MARPSCLLFGLCLVSFCVYKVYSINCFKCESKTSWQDCNNNARKVNCSDIKHLNNCMQQYEYKIFVNGTKMQNSDHYKRGCAAREQCNGLEDYCARLGMRCKINCCPKDFCNGYNSATSKAGPYLVAYLFPIVYIIN
ncbi:uncharacterized protein LOC110232588 [Exaiptasia diaphana]|uniref:Uncharacterized protein n=1 Tax=Exaiptasia diaphana TaxID=2652724 RepID=A0A913WSK3_EXADI|nr:uncharacterized protein LOC110232588 [Exaiptasia diaphana]